MPPSGSSIQRLWKRKSRFFQPANKATPPEQAIQRVNTPSLNVNLPPTQLDGLLDLFETQLQVCRQEFDLDIQRSIRAASLDPPSSHSTQPQCRFLQLPGEIRNQIYAFIAMPELKENGLPRNHQVSGTSLLQTCHQIYAEFLPMVYRHLIVYAMHTMRIKFYQTIPPRLLSLMSTVYLTEAAVSLEKWSRYHAWRHRTYDCVQRTLCSANFHPITLIFVSHFARYDCAVREHLDQNMHRSQFHTAMMDFHFALSIIATIEVVHFIDLDSGLNPHRIPWPGCFHCSHPNVLPSPNANEVYTKPGCAEMFELEYDWEPGRPGLSYDHYRVDGRFRIEKCETDKCDYWLDIRKKGLRRVAVHIYDNWGQFCERWRGPFRRPAPEGK
jgi:hypothetical protein